MVLEAGARVRAVAGWEFMEQKDTATGPGQEPRVGASAGGGVGLEELQTKAGLSVPQMGLASQGTARAGALGSGQVDPSLDLPTNGGTTTLGRVTLGGRTALGGEPLHRVPRIQTLSLGRRMLPGALEGTGETRSPGVAAKPKVRSQENATEGRSAWHMENPVSSTLPAAGSGSRPATACHSISSLFPPGPSRDMTGVPLVWLCVASSHGPWGHRSPRPPGVTTCVERHRDGRWGEDKCGQRGKAQTLLGELKECFLEEAADEAHWN